MKKIIFTSVLLMVSFFSNAQSIDEKLKSDMVKIENSKLILEDYTLVKTKDGNIQIKGHCEAPQAIISRDRFTYYSSEVLTNLLEEIIGDNNESEDLSEIVGTPDITINCYMAKTGLQVEVITSEGTNKSMLKWVDVL